MRTDSIKLTGAQQRDLEEISRILCGQYQIEKIICFGALNLKIAKETCFMEAEGELKNTYYLLVMTTENTRIEYAMQDFIIKQFPEVFIIAHGLQTVIDAIHKNDRFFVNAGLNGQLIYTSDGFTMIPEFERKRIDQAYLKDCEAFEQIYSLASGFLECAFDCYEKGFYNNVAFLLHQVVEQACRGLIRLYTGYHSDIHNLSRLLDLCNCFSTEPAKLFRRHFAEEKRLFRVLAGSYTEARYRDNYKVIDHDADELCTLVKAFLDLTLELSSIESHRGAARTTEERKAAVMDYSPALSASL